MKTRRTDTGIAVQELTDEEAGLMMTAVLQMAEEADRAGNHNHAAYFTACRDADRQVFT